MGVTNLWTVLGSCMEHDVPTSSFSGQTLAVDLSAWLVEFSKVKTKGGRRFNLCVRNLLYRILHLMSQGLKLLFVVEGKVPDVKRNTMIQRQKQNFGALSPTCKSSQLADRSSFNCYTETSCELLDSLGVPWLRSEGEGEALCAQLNKDGVVDACMTEDSDVLLYGARRVYRNFRRVGADSYVDICQMEDVESDLNLNRQDLIAMALMIGCDYHKQGVKNVGKIKSMNLVEEFKAKNLDPLERLCGWRENEELIKHQAVLSSDDRQQMHCSKCAHIGTVECHRSGGCEPCDTQTDCRADSDPCHCLLCKARVNKLELDLRDKALQDALFPHHDIIKEFLNFKCDNLESVEVDYKPPSLSKLIAFLEQYIKIEGEKMMKHLCVAFLQLQLKHISKFSCLCFKPRRIIKHCKHSHRPSYEIEWEKLDSDIWTISDVYTMKVEREQFSTNFPVMAEEYESQCMRTLEGKKRQKARCQTTVDDFFKRTKRLRSVKNSGIIID
ncbi:hypothetical protein ScPMuIL_017936 [Solemya velum]